MNTSLLLSNVLKKIFNIESLLITDSGNRHWYLVCRGLIIDLTAKQFDDSLPDILIIPVNEKPNILDFGMTNAQQPWEIGNSAKLKSLQLGIEHLLKGN